MPGLIDTLENNPAAFLSIVGAAPIYVDDPDFTQAVKPHTAPSAQAEMLKIVGRDRIAFARFSGDNSGKRFDLQVSGKATNGSRPCYWLPWKLNAAVQIKLRPSKKRRLAALAPHHRATETAQGSSSIALAANASAWSDRGVGDDVDPDLFFTGMMNGCSVWVSGDPEQPLVYHINRASHAQAEVGRLLMQPKDRDKEINKLKSDQMGRDFAEFDKTAGAAGGKVGRVTPSTEHLRNPVTGKAADAAKSGRTKLIEGLGKGSKLLIHDPKNTKYYIQRSLVTAFGVRTAGRWRFYKQDIYEYLLYDASGQNPDRSQPSRVAATRPEQFFP